MNAAPAPDARQAANTGPDRGPDAGAITVGLALGTWLVAWVIVNLIGGLIAAGLTPDGEDPPIRALTLIQLISAGVFAGALAVASLRKQRQAPNAPLTVDELRHDYHLWFRPVDLGALPLGVATQLLAVPLVYLPLRALWPDTFTSERLTETAEDLVDRAGGGAQVVLLVLVVCLVAPVIEELVYRGLLQGAFARRLGRVAGWLVASALFALIHFRPVEYPGLFVAGLVFGGCFAVTRRLAPAILCHLAFNVTGLVLVW